MTPTPVPILNSEVFSIPIEGGAWLVYAPLRRAAFAANAAGVNWLARLRRGENLPYGTSDADMIALLRSLEIVDGSPEIPPIEEYRGDPEPTAVTLFLTTACNLRCTYCYASAGDTPAKSMTLQIAKRGIDFIVNNAIRKGAPSVEIAYHGGGEPSANWAVMTGSMAWARERAAEARLEITASAATNGVLRDDQIDWFIENLTGVSVSFDGPPAAHDKHRPLAGGGGSGERVMHTLRRFDAAGYAYGVRLTATHDQLAGLADSVEFICANFRPGRIQVDPAYQLGRWAEAPSAETEEFLAAFREAQGRARKLGFEISYSGARLESLTNHFCGISRDSFALTPDGNVSSCYEAFSETNPFADIFFYGKPEAEGAGYRFDMAALETLRRQAVQHRPYCQGCFAKWHCAGDCFHKSLAVNGRGEFRGSERCHITRELTKDQLLAKIAESGGVFWHEPPPESARLPDSKAAES